MSSQDLFIVDLFAGGGGASEGIRAALGRGPDVAVNHDAHAIDMHSINHPDAVHHQTDVFEVDPVEACGGRRPDLLWASPDCTHFSRAKGSKPKSKEIRSLAWVVVLWARKVQPRVICLENVEEFKTWGPLDEDGRPIPERAGETFDEWRKALEGEGYSVEFRSLVAADYGTPTTRKRLFMVARCDGRAPRWPEPTHGPGRSRPYRTAAEVIDWSLPAPSIFTRKRPLADATHRRIAHGIMRFVVNTSTPYVHDGHGRCLIQTGYGERKGQRPRTLDLHKPLGTVVAGGSKHALVTAFISKHYTGVVGHKLDRPLGTITAVDHHSLTTASTGGDEAGARRVASFLTKYYSAPSNGQSLFESMHTVTATDRFGLVSLELEGTRHLITDIGMRMLQPHELAAAQGFGPDYVLTGTKRDKTARIGNSVCPPLAAALVACQFPEALREAA